MDNKKIILDMLDEIHTICRNKKIQYFVADGLALSVFNNGKMDNKPWYTGTILMTAEGIKQFISAFNEKKIKNRSIEWMGNNKNFPGPFLRYVNTKTLYCTPERLAIENDLGMCITIELLRYSKGKKRKYYEPLEKAWRDLSFDIKKRKGKKLNIYKIFLKLGCIVFGKGRLALKLNDFFLKKCTFDKSSRFAYIKD